jgi:glycogen debranching enzyme
MIEHLTVGAGADRRCTPIGPRIDGRRLADLLCELGSVDRLADLGAHGPLMASGGRRSLFHCLFGRDATRMAMDLLDDFPAVARATVLELARLQGIRDNPRGDEEPGRIIHEHRAPDDPHAARLGEHWDFPYYGAVDSTPQWINLVVALCAREGRAILSAELTDRRGRPRTVGDALGDAVAWLLRRLDDPIGAGFVWVRRASPHGIPNQVWEDSGDSYYHEDGTVFDFTRPYAPVAVQGYAYDALLGAAGLLQDGARRRCDRPRMLRARAARLRARVLSELWLPELGTFAHALTVQPDGALRPARVVASAAGHLLASRLLDGPGAAAYRHALIARLARDDLLAGAGVRTKAVGAARFGPGTYHNGSTWPMDTGVIADGLRRHGATAQADDLEGRILRGCAQVGGFPEFFRGDEDGTARVNTAIVDRVVDGVLNRLEQPPQANQGWTATRVWRILRRRSGSPSGGGARPGRQVPA